MKLVEDHEISTNLGGDLKILNRDGKDLNGDGKYQLYQIKSDFGQGDPSSPGFEYAYSSLTVIVIRLAISQEYIIAALFITRRALNTKAVARTFKPLWQAERGFKIQREGDHKLLFIFDNQEDVDRILANEPWSFDKSLVVLQRYDRNSPIDELSFDKTDFWVQVHNIPIKYKAKSVAKDIFESIGKVHRLDENSEGGGGSFMRIRVTLDVYQPLCRGCVIKLEEGGKVWVNFKFDHLPNICYWCGYFDHIDKDCDLWIQSKGTLQHASQ
ncbi:uncharacterized protein LOC142616372 [Castanea sativa]|uniref:uncharacterized protein LOC142616372 n=1 Tax=Castanea sativa TaxID=21020 RepID=UPI003F64A207